MPLERSVISIVSLLGRGDQLMIAPSLLYLFPREKVVPSKSSRVEESEYIGQSYGGAGSRRVVGCCDVSGPLLRIRRVTRETEKSNSLGCKSQ
jgi:hypothetical protein